MATLRWILVPVVGIAAWYAALFTMGAFDWLYWKFDYPCPYEQVTSGGCPGIGLDWHSRYVDVLMSIGAGLAAIYIVAGCVWMAPQHKARTALAVFGVGAIVAGFMGLSLEERRPMVVALLAGAGAAAFLYRRYVGERVA